MIKLRGITGMLLLFCLGSLTGQVPASHSDRPNVLFIMTDDLSSFIFDYGKDEVIAPNIRALAQRGLRFERAYCQAPLCNPSRTSIMTGRYPHENQIWTNGPHFRGIYPRMKTLPQRFKENGYHTVDIGKIYHNWGQSIHGDPDSWSEPQVYNWAAHFQDWYVPGRPYEVHSDLKKGPAVQCEDVPDEAYLDGRIANAAVEKLRELRETPFFLAVGFWKPHLPYNAPKKYWDLYDRDHLPPVRYKHPVKGTPDIAYVDSKEARSYTDVPNEGPIPGDKKKELRHGYLAGISFVDTQIGKVLDELDRLDLTRKTIVVFLSDHGYHAGEHGQFGKWTNFEIGTRVPLIILTPGMPDPGVTSKSLVELIDLYPTLLDLCGIELPANREKLSGLSLVPVIRDPEASVRPWAISQITRPLGADADFTILGSTIRTDRYRYVIWKERKDGSVVAEEFYDLSHDPLEVKNIVNDSGIIKIKDQLNEELMKFVRK